MLGPTSYPIPDAFRPMLERLVHAAEDTLDKGRALPSMYFVGNTSTGALESVTLNTSSVSTKVESAERAKNMALMISADFVLTMSEAWALPAAKLAQSEKIYQKYGSIGNYPGRVDVVMFALETSDEVFMGTGNIVKVPPSKTKRKLEAITWLSGHTAEGILAGILRKPSAYH